MQILADYKSKMLESMSHNLKTPLNGLMLYLYSMKNVIHDNSPISDMVK